MASNSFGSLLALLLPILGLASLLSCPPYMVLVEKTGSNPPQYVCVDQYEAYLLEIISPKVERLFPFNSPVTNQTVRAAVLPDAIPQGYMSAKVGAEACERSGKRLCSLEDWLSACQGPEEFVYPYGNEYEEGYCNEGRPVNPVIELFGQNATFNMTEMNDPRLDLLPHTLAPSGNFSKCVSSYGAYDMHGNLDEWVSDVNSTTGHGIFKGGYFVDAKINGHGCLYRTIAHAPTYHDYSLGFRCCADPA